MKLSDFNSDKAAEKLCEVSVWLKPILSDEDVLAIISDEVDMQGKTTAYAVAMGFSRILDAIPLILKRHREALFSIVATINEASLEDVKNQPFSDTIDQTMEIVGDPIFQKLFFMSTQTQMQLS
jgi:hypothetical protein